MPEAPPSAPPAAPAISPPPPPPAPTKAIHVTPAGMDAGPAPAPPKRGSAREEMFKDLRKKSAPSNSPDVKPTPPPAKAEPEEKPAPESPLTSPEESSSEKPGAGTPVEMTPEEKKKVSPWKLVEDYKKRHALLEKELAEARTTRLDPKEKEELTTRLSTYEKRAKELEDEIRYVNFTKSEEYAAKYQKPYEEAWVKAMSDLGELTIEDPATGQSRPIKAQDVLDLVNLPLQKAREQANTLFGDFADDVMAHRKEIKNLFEAQQKALDDARKNGAAREEQRHRQIQEYREKVHKEINQIWTEANEAVLKDEKNAPFFKPVEGDEEGNKRLSRGYELADRAFTLNPADPRLTPDQRAEAVRIHAAVRNRAAAAGRLLYWLQQERENTKALKAELAKYQGAEPGSGEGAKGTQPDSRSSARDQVFGALRKFAH